MTYKLNNENVAALAAKAFDELNITLNTDFKDTQNSNMALKFFKANPPIQAQMTKFVRIFLLCMVKKLDLSATTASLVRRMEFTKSENCSDEQKVAFMFRALNKASDMVFSTDTVTKWSDYKYYRVTTFTAPDSFLKPLFEKVDSSVEYLTEPPADWTNWFANDEVANCIIRKANKRESSMEAVLMTDPADCANAFATANAMQKVRFKPNPSALRAMKIAETALSKKALMRKAKDLIYAKAEADAIEAAES
jgi:hypothetical protein